MVSLLCLHFVLGYGQVQGQYAIATRGVGQGIGVSSAGRVGLSLPGIAVARSDGLSGGAGARLGGDDQSGGFDRV